jgi:phage shock protein C
MTKQPTDMEKRLERYPDEAQLGGVAAGIAHYFNIDRTLVRVLFVAGIFALHGAAIVIYLVLWAVLPERRGIFTATSESTIFSSPSFSMASPNKQVGRDPGQGSLIGGGILIIIGVIALLERYTNVNWRDIWPLLLIGFGAWLILRDRKSTDLYSDPADRPTPPSTNDPYDPNRPINQV